MIRVCANNSVPFQLRRAAGVSPARVGPAQRGPRIPGSPPGRPSPPRVFDIESKPIALTVAPQAVVGEK